MSILLATAARILWRTAILLDTRVGPFVETAANTISGWGHTLDQHAERLADQ